QLGKAFAPGGSGQSGVWTAPVPTMVSDGSEGPGSTYDVFAAEGAHFYIYTGGVDGTAFTGSGWSTAFDTHVDTWWLAIPPSEDRNSGLCTVYATHEGGISVNAAPGVSDGSMAPCRFDTPGLWVTAGSGLHALFSIIVSGLSQADVRVPVWDAECSQAFG